MTTIRVRAGKTTRILSRFSNSVSVTYRFSARSVTDGEGPSGIVEVKGSHWILPKPPTVQRLVRENTVSKSMLDTFFNVYVTPEQDADIEIEAGRLNKALFGGVLTVGIIVLAVGLIVATLPRP